MNVTKLVFKSHKWLAVATSILTVLWFFSGIFMTMPAFLQRALADSAAPTASPTSEIYRSIRVPIADAIALVDQAAGSPVLVNNIVLRMIAGKLYYRVVTNQGSNLVDAVDGSFLKIDEGVARQLAVHAGARAEELGSATLINRLDGLYTWGPLPVWKIQANDKGATVFYVDPGGGEVNVYGRSKRIMMHLIGMHSLEFLNPWLSKGKIRFIMWTFTIIGNVMVFFGLWILWIQYVNWRQRRAH